MTKKSFCFLFEASPVRAIKVNEGAGEAERVDEIEESEKDGKVVGVEGG